MPRKGENYITFDYDALNALDDECQGVFCFTSREVSMLLSSARFMLWPSRWEGSDGQLLRDVGRSDDLELALQIAERIHQKLIEC